MSCQPYREALSARLDDEPLGMSQRALDEHLSGCPGCASWADDATDVTRRVRLAPAPRMKWSRKSDAMGWYGRASSTIASNSPRV